jgi:O-antigen/teichoic acid export membrane protein
VNISFNKKSSYQFIENTVSLFSIKAIDLGLTIWLIPFLIIKVGVENYGIYVFAMALVVFFVNVLNYGFSLATVRELAKNKEDSIKLNLIFNEVVSVKMVLFVVEYLIFLVLIAIFPKFWEFKQLYLFTSFILVTELFSLRWFFLGIEKVKYTAIINLLGTVGYVLLVLFFIEEKTDFIYIPLLESIGVLIVSIIAFVWVLKKYQLKLKFTSFEEVGSYLKLNFSSFINSLLPATFGNSIVFIVGVFGVPTHVSFMQIGLKITNAFSTLNAILTKVFYPMVNRKEAVMLPSRLVLLIIGIVLSLVLFFGCTILISNWLTFDSPKDYSKVIVIVKILSPIPLLMAVISSYGINGLLAYYKDGLYGRITIFSTLITIIFASLLIPIYAFYGAAFSLVLGRLIYAIWSYYSFKKLKNEFIS